MKVEEAFLMLNVELDATVEDIDTAYRELTKKVHPDVSDDSGESQIALNEAREVALAYAKVRKDVVVVSPTALESRLKLAVEKSNTESVREYARSRFRRKSLPIEFLKWASWFAGAAAAIVALTTGNAEGVLGLDETEVTDLKLALQPMAFLFGVCGLYLQFAIKHAESKVDSFLELISDKAECAQKLSDAIRYQDRTELERGEIIRGVGDSFSSDSLFRGFVRKDELILKKSVEHGLLEEVREDDLRPNQMVKYRVMFRPSLFKPASVVSERSNRPMTLAGAVQLSIFAIVIFAALSTLTGWTFMNFHWGWSILPGAMTLGALPMCLAAFSEMYRAKRDAR